MHDFDMKKYIEPKSDQLNADDLIAGPITVQILAVKETGAKEQPVLIELSDGKRPWKPCKTDRRILFVLLGERPSKWVSCYVTLYRDPTAPWQGKPVGGVRISHLSAIEKDTIVTVTESKGKKKERLIKRLVVQSDKQAASQPATKTTVPKKPEPMSDEEFLTRLNVAKTSIEAGKATADQVIEKIEAAVLLTEVQREELETLKPQAAQGVDPQAVQDNPTDAPTDAPDDMFDN